MTTVVTGSIGRLIYARLEPGADLLLALQDIIRSEDIRTGLILDITGGLQKARLQHNMELGDPNSKVSVVEIPGPMEASGSGIIGRSIGNGGVGNYRDGEPYIHCHITINSAVQTFMGHLMEGCTIRSPHSVSHFTVVLAEASGIQLDMVSGGPGPENGGRGVWTKEHGHVYHELRGVGGPSSPANSGEST